MAVIFNVLHFRRDLLNVASDWLCCKAQWRMSRDAARTNRLPSGSGGCEEVLLAGFDLKGFCPVTFHIYYGRSLLFPTWILKQPEKHSICRVRLKHYNCHRPHCPKLVPLGWTLSNKSTKKKKHQSRLKIQFSFADVQVTLISCLVFAQLSYKAPSSVFPSEVPLFSQQLRKRTLKSYTIF